MRNWVVVTAALVLFITSHAVPSPALAEELRFVTTDELKAMLDGKEDFLLANTLSPIEFAERHIPGSVNIPPELIESGEATLPGDKGGKIVFYCMGPK